MGVVCNLVNLIALETCSNLDITSLFLFSLFLFLLQGGALWFFSLL